MRAVVTPTARPGALELLERGAPRTSRAEIGLAHLPRDIADREWAVLRRELARWPLERVDLDLATSVGPGNHVSVRLEHEHATEVLTGFGERGVSAERVAHRVAEEARRYLAATAPVGVHLADQLMLPLALLAGGRYRTLRPSRHAYTNAEVVNAFLPGAVRIEEGIGDEAVVTVRGRPRPDPRAQP